MKIRNGFVSNSSSSSFTCYEVVVSPHFTLTKKMFDAAYEYTTENYDEVSDIPRDEFDDTISHAIAGLKNGRSYTPNIDECGPCWEHETILFILRHFGGGAMISSEASTEYCHMTPLDASTIIRKIDFLHDALAYLNGHSVNDVR